MAETKHRSVPTGALRRLSTLLNIPLIDPRTQGPSELLHAAADEIERLQAENKRLVACIEESEQDALGRPV